MAERDLVEVRLRLPRDTHQRLREVVGSRQMSPTVRSLIDDYLERSPERRRIDELRRIRREGR